MNKIILLVVFQFLSFSIFAQNNLYVLYKTNISNSVSQATLIASKTQSVYEEGIEFKERETDDLGGGRFALGTWDHLKIYQNINELGTIKIQLFQNKGQLSYVPKDYNIIDAMPKMNWVINEKKAPIEIHGYSCQEATVEFRGSKFYAYFTNEIPTTFGPWKFHGLPGLILKVRSAQNPAIYWEAEKIVYPYKDEFIDESDSISFDMTMKEYVDEFDELILERQKNFAAKTGGIVHPIPQSMKRAKSREAKYEWETW